MANTKQSVASYADWIRDNIRVQRSRYTPRLEEFLDGRSETGNFLLLKGAGGLGKTVLTEPWRHCASAAGRGKPENARITLELEFNLSAKTDRDTDDERIVDEKDQADFRWGRCLNKLKRQLARIDRPGEKSKRREIMPVFTSFYDRCISRENTEQRKARRREWIGSLSLLASFILILTSSVPNIVGGITGYQLSGLTQLGIGLVGGGLGLLALQQFVAIAADALFDRGHYRKLGMSPSDFREASIDDDTGGLEEIDEIQITQVFLYDLARWYKKKSKRKFRPNILIILDIHNFVDDAKARHALVKGIEAFLHRDQKLAKLLSRLPLKILVASNAEAIHSSLSHALGRGVEGSCGNAISVANLEPSEAFLMVAEIFGRLRPEDLGPGTLASAVAEVAAQVDRTPGNSRLPSAEGDNDILRTAAIEIIRFLASGTATDANNRSPTAIRDRTACFLAGQGKQKVSGSISKRVILHNVAQELDKREQSFLQNAFGDLKTYETACFLAAFDWGLTKNEWPSELEQAGSFLSFEEVRQKSEFVCKPDPERGAEAVNLRYDTRVLLSAGAQHYIRYPVWKALGETFARICREKLYLDPGFVSDDLEDPAEIGEALPHARRAIACMKAAAIHEAFHNQNLFDNYDLRAPALLNWTARAVEQAEVQQAGQALRVLEEAAVTAAYLIAPTFRSGGDGILRQPRLLTAALKVIRTYLHRMGEDRLDMPFPSRASEGFKLASLAALARLDNEENLNLLGRVLGSDPAGLRLVNETIDRLRELHEADPEESQALNNLMSVYWRRKLRTIKDNVEDFNYFAGIPLTSFSPAVRLDYVETLRKLANSVASYHLHRGDWKVDSSENAEPLTGAERSEYDEPFISSVYDRFIHTALERIHAVEMDGTDWNPNDRWRLCWCHLRTCLYWLSELSKMAGEQARPLLVIPGTLLSSIEDLISRLEGIDGRPRAEQLVEIDKQAKALSRDLPDLSQRLMDLHDIVHKRGLGSRLGKANALLEHVNSTDDDWRPVFQELVSVLALSWRAMNQQDPATDAEIRALRREVLKLYAKAVLQNAANHPSALRPLDLSGLAGEIDAFVKAGALAVAENPSRGSPDPEFSQSLLRLLSYQNPSRAEARQGAWVVAKVSQIHSVDGKDANALSPRVVFEVPHSDLEIALSKDYWPTGLYNQATNNSKVHTHKDWQGKLVIVVLRKKDDEQQTDSPWPATARGADYNETCLQLFSPLFANWDALKAVQVPGSNHRPVSWVGASGSWLVVRTGQEWMDAVLENYGAFNAHLPMLTALGRLSYFCGSDVAEFPDEVARDIDIRRFVRATYRDLRYVRKENGMAAFFRREGKGPRDPSLPDPWSHNKNRTFLSMFRKVFNEDATIEGWTDPRTQEGRTDEPDEEEVAYENELA